jgi:alkylated DNA repair dioxygenase AlkB
MGKKVVVFKNNSEELILFLRFFENFVSPDQIENSTFFQSIPWRQNSITVFGKQHLEPRLTAWMGPSYRYSNIQWETTPFHPAVSPLIQSLHEVVGIHFNSCLFNFYRNGKDSMGKHRDNEPEMDTTCIASLSFGATRKIKFTHRLTNEKISISLAHGDLLLMNHFQDNWMHEIPKVSKCNPRLNLTFRNIRK